MLEEDGLGDVENLSGRGGGVARRARPSSRAESNEPGRQRSTRLESQSTVRATDAVKTQRAAPNRRIVAPNRTGARDARHSGAQADEHENGRERERGSFHEGLLYHCPAEVEGPTSVRSGVSVRFPAARRSRRPRFSETQRTVIRYAFDASRTTSRASVSCPALALARPRW